MARSVKEWIGKTDDSAIPRSVRERVYNRSQGYCTLCSLKIDAGDEVHMDHRIPLKDGGEHRETNLQAAHGPCHRWKTARENAERAPINRKRAKHLGITKPNSKFSKRGRAISELAKELHGQPGFERYDDARTEAERRLQ